MYMFFLVYTEFNVPYDFKFVVYGELVSTLTN